MATNFTKKNEDKYCCELCDYNTCKITDYNRHIKTTKHLSNKTATTSNKKNEKNTFTCENCNKFYKDRTGLWRHKKSCSNTYNCHSENIENNLEPNNTKLIMQLIKENTELKSGASDKDLIVMLINENKELKTLMIEQQNMMMKVIENGTHNTTNNTTHTNSHNKAFNLNFFLNETCKEAMNIGEFVDSLKIQLSDLEHVGEAGYIEGISSIIVKNLKELDVTKRPVHCTDKKRETVYIKDNDIWEKDEDKTHMHKLIKRVASKNMKMFEKFRDAHPDCLKYHSKYSDQYNKIVYESMGGKGDDDIFKNEKIIKNVLKEVIVDKNI
jgi:hypothetical protein